MKGEATMRTIKNTLMAIGAFVAVQVFGGGGTALAVTQLTSPFGSTTPVQVFIGANSAGTAQAVLWKRLSDGACLSNTIGSGSGLFDDYQIVTSSGNDDVRILVGSLVTSFCSIAVKGLVYGGHYLDLYGGAGNDVMSSANGDTWIFGQDGNDGIFFSGFGRLFGGTGNDKLVAASAIFTAEGLFGDDGSDCLEDRNAAAATFDCGAGTDSWSGAFGTR
jgi:Ca2+-binding RTX toxin-like protein